MIAKKTGREAEGKALALGLLVLALVAACLLLTARPAHADTFRVNSMEDAWDNSSTDGECATDFFQPGTEPNCTLRAAIGEANFNDESDTIIFDPALSGTITLTLGQLDITADDAVALFGHRLDIQGPGARTITVSGNDASRVFHINEFAIATISGLTISDGSADCSCDDVSPDNSGGGILNDDGALFLTNTTVSENTAKTGGGGIQNSNVGSTLTLTNSTVSGNTANIAGGIINHGTMELTNSTVSGNTATTTNGGGIGNGGTIELTNSTVSGNTAAQNGGGIINPSGATIKLRNTIIARNTATTGPDAQGAFTSEGNNLIGDSTGATGFVASDLLNTNPLLGPLQDNGGPTRTHALLPGSPAVDAANNTTCPSRDQRGVLRTDGDKNGTVVCDIGAFERNDLTPPKVTRVVPDEDATARAPATNVFAVFSEPMRPATINAATFRLRKAGETASVAATVTYDAAKRRATLDPAANLERGATYVATVTGGARDLAGNRLDQDPGVTGDQPKSWRFTVRQ